MKWYFAAGCFLVVSALAVLYFLTRTPTKIAAPSTGTVSGLRYVALGDSYTIGEGLPEEDRWPNQLVGQLETQGIEVTPVANPSRTGYTTEDLLKHEVKVLQDSRAGFVTVQIGVNDYVRGVSNSEFEQRFNKVLDAIQSAAPRAKLLVVTIPDYGKTPSGAQFGTPESTEIGIKAYNNIIIDEAGRRNLPVADIFAISQTSSSAGELSSDGLHPSGAQYTKWLTVITPEVQKLLKN